MPGTHQSSHIMAIANSLGASGRRHVFVVYNLQVNFGVLVNVTVGLLHGVLPVQAT